MEIKALWLIQVHCFVVNLFLLFFFSEKQKQKNNKICHRIMFQKYNELCNYLKQSTSPEFCLGPDQRPMMMFFAKIVDFIR